VGLDGYGVKRDTEQPAGVAVDWHKDCITEGYVVGFSFTKGAYDEVARVKRKNGLEIELLTVKELVEKFGK